MPPDPSKSQKPALMKFVYQLPGFFLLILRRQQYHLGLVILALLGIILSVGMVTNASFFSQAVDRTILLQNLSEFSRVTGRPPLSTNVYVFPSVRNPLTLEDSETLSRTIGDTLASSVGLPLRQLGIEISSGTMLLQPKPGSDLSEQGRNLLGTVNAVYIANIADHMVMDAGNPLDAVQVSSDGMDVWMHARLA